MSELHNCIDAAMAEQPTTTHTNTQPPPPPTCNLDKLTNTPSNLGIIPPSTSSIASITNTISNLAITNDTHRDDVYTILNAVNPTSLRSVNNAIDLYALLETFYAQQLDLDRGEEPQLDVVRDLMAARKCWVILHEQRGALVSGEGDREILGIWDELMRVWIVDEVERGVRGER